MRHKLSGLLFVAVVMWSPAGFGGSKTNAQETERTAAEQSIVRLISAAESIYFHEQGRYASYPELIQSGQIQRTAKESTDYMRGLALLRLESESQPVIGFTLNLTISGGGTGYHLYLTQRGDRCGNGWFTDETGILYGGKALSCAEEPTMTTVRTWGPVDIDAEIPPVRNKDSCPLPEILRQASQRATELVDNLQRFTATERIEHIEFSKGGKVRNSSHEMFNYVAEIEQNSPGGFGIKEYRSAKSESTPVPLSDTGTAAFALIFHPHLIANFDIRCEGQADVKGTPAWQLHFSETADPGKSFHAIRIGASTYQVRFKGRAWLTADNYEVLRLQTDMVAPMPQINLLLEHLDIAYAPVEFAQHKFRLWLPETASMHINYNGHRYERVHEFSHFQLFLVDTEQRVKEPIPAPPGVVQ